LSRILISGASGFVGKALTAHLLSQGHTIVKLKRRRVEEEENTLFWDPEEGEILIQEKFDAVVHLAGEPFSFGRWSETKKEKILSSRVVGTRLLAEAFVDNPPKIFISASAIGFYGDRGEEILTEKSSQGKGFLAHVCSEWEKASSPLAKRGGRTVQTRFGMVIGKGSRALKNMLLPYKLGLGGNLGSGKQWVSWVALDDLIRAIEMIIKNDSFQGPVNIVSPNPVRQEEFSKILAHILHRPSRMTMPAWLIRFLFGVLADEMLLASARVEPAKLLVSGFKYKYPHLSDALNKAIQK